ncbi:MAG: type I-G CRISPR-associated protein Csb2 [Solirubrobacteraceae bacterium]
MFAIRCQFLNGTYQAAMPGSVSDPEWPPHPARLHAALVAAGWAIGGDAFPEEAHAALSWLERLAAPSLSCAARISERTAPTVYVPRNLTDAETRDILNAMRAGRDVSRQVGRVERTFPTSVPGEEPVWFLWGAEGTAHMPALERLAREVQYLGSSRSPVCCDVVDEPEISPTLLPRSNVPAASLRIATAGFTDRLLASRHVQPPPRLGAFAPYGEAAESAPPFQVAARGPFGDLVVRAFDQAFPYTILHAPAIARAFRDAVLAHAGDDAPAILHGHGRNPHVAFLPLANVGLAHASGQIVGVAAAVPEAADETEREQIITAVTRVTALRNLGLDQTWRLRPASERTLFALAPHRWTGPARRWQTVTPVILDRHPKTRSLAAFERALRATFEHAGLPHSPEHVDWSEIPWQPAAVPAPAYRGGDLPDGLRIHVDVTFEQPLRGPLLAGRGRYFGVGLFAPVQSDEDSQDADE